MVSKGPLQMFISWWDFHDEQKLPQFQHRSFLAFFPCFCSHRWTQQGYLWQLQTSPFANNPFWTPQFCYTEFSCMHEQLPKNLFSFFSFGFLKIDITLVISLPLKFFNSFWLPSCELLKQAGDSWALCVTGQGKKEVNFKTLTECTRFLFT